MHRDSTQNLVKLLLTSEDAANKWHSQPVMAHIVARLSSPDNLDQIVSVARAHWPPPTELVAEVGPSTVRALVLPNDHMIAVSAEAEFPSGVAYAPQLLDGVVIWSQTDTLRVWWALLPSCE